MNINSLTKKSDVLILYYITVQSSQYNMISGKSNCEIDCSATYLMDRTGAGINNKKKEFCLAAVPARRAKCSF